MARWTWLAVVVLALSLAAVVEAVGPAPGASGAPSRPNVVVIFADDMRADDLQFMKATRRLLGDQGVEFVNAVSPNPLCCPARATLLTGQYSHNTGVLSNGPPDGGVRAFDARRALPPYLQRVGYRTAFVGKYLNQYPRPGERTEVPPGWDAWRAPVNSLYSYKSNRFNVDGRLTREDGYRTDVYTEHATELIRQWSRTRRPYMLMLSHLAPHTRQTATGWLPPQPARRDKGALRGQVGIPASPAFDEVDVSDKPAWVRELDPLSRGKVRKVARRRQLRAESLLSVDRSVKRIVRTLRRVGDLDDTIVVFTSDNGYMLGEHRKANEKTVAYEESSHVPLLVRGPGYAPGTTQRSLVGLHDVAATIGEVTGATARVPYEMDGEPLLDVSPDRPVLLEAGSRMTPKVVAPEGQRSYTAIRTDRYVYVRLFTGEEELYDLDRDPWQLRSVHDDRDYDAVRRRLGAALDGLQDCVGASCRTTVAVD